MSRRAPAKRERSKRKQAKKFKQAIRNRTTNKESLAVLQNWFLPDDGIFAKLKFHGNTTWAAGSLVWLALYWSWSESRFVTDAFAEALECCQSVSASSPLSTYQGFMGAMVKWTSPFINQLCLLLQERMEEITHGQTDDQALQNALGSGSRISRPQADIGSCKTPLP